MATVRISFTDVSMTNFYFNLLPWEVSDYDFWEKKQKQKSEQLKNSYSDDLVDFKHQSD